MIYTLMQIFRSCPYIEEIVVPGVRAEVITSYSDALAENPIGVTITQRTISNNTGLAVQWNLWTYGNEYQRNKFNWRLCRSILWTGMPRWILLTVVRWSSIRLTSFPRLTETHRFRSRLWSSTITSIPMPGWVLSPLSNVFAGRRILNYDAEITMVWWPAPANGHTWLPTGMAQRWYRFRRRSCPDVWSAAGEHSSRQ